MVFLFFFSFVENGWEGPAFYVETITGRSCEAHFANFCFGPDPYVGELWTVVEAMVYAALDDIGTGDDLGKEGDTGGGKKEESMR